MTLSALHDRITTELLLGGARVGLYFEDLADSESLSIQAETAFPLASVIKVPIMAHIMRSAASGAISLSDRIELDLSDPAWSQIDGSGVLTYLTSRIALNLRDLVALSIIESDNLATNCLIARVGIPAINETLQSLGMTQTTVTHVIEDFPTLRLPGSNPGTARDLGRLYKAIFNGALPHHDLMIDLLCKQKYTSRLPYFLPTDDELLRIGHKTGTLNTLTHDSGLIMHPRFNYTLSVLTQHQTTHANAALIIARCSEWVYRYVTSKYHALAVG